MRIHRVLPLHSQYVYETHLKIKNLNIFGNSNVPNDSKKKKLHKKTISALGKQPKETVEKAPTKLKKDMQALEAKELKESLEKIGCTVTLL